MSADPKELAAEYDLDRRAAENLVAYLREQQAATRVVPSDETVVVERFRDEIGDWRLCVLSPWGGRVHAAWGLALSARIRDEHELEADAIWSDDGIVVHLPDADEAPPADLVLLEPDEIEDLVVRELASSALFGARFRENAARALLIPRAYPGKRTPLWQQRLQGAEPARGGEGLPAVPDRARDLPRVPSRRARPAQPWSRCCATSSARRISLVEVETPTASPFASSLLFDYVATYMYEGDTPNAERRAAALSLDRELLRELLGQEELRELIDPEALAEVEDSLQHRAELARAKDRDALQQILRRLGDLTAAECEQRVAEGYSADSMLGEARARAPRRPRARSPARSAGSPPRTRRSTATRSACRRRPGLPETFLAEPPRRDGRPGPPLRAHPRPVPDRRSSPRRYGVDPAAALRELERAGELVRGELLPGGTEREWCDPEVLRRLRRASLAHLRAEAEAVDPRELARFLPSWQNVDAHRPGGRRARPAARGAGAAPGRRADAGGLGARRAAAAAGRLQPRLARRALHRRRAGLDRRRRARAKRRQGGALLPRGRAARRPAARQR